MSRSARPFVASIVGLATSVGLAIGVAPASATPTTVYSPVSILTAPAVDILSGTVNYEPVRGSLSATIVLRGAPRVLPNGGPGYTVGLYGPQRHIGGGAFVSLSSIGVPADARLEVSRTNDGVTTAVPVAVRFSGNRVEFSATDDRLANLPVRFFDIQATRTRSPEPGSFFGNDGIYGSALR